MDETKNKSVEQACRKMEDNQLQKTQNQHSRWKENTGKTTKTLETMLDIIVGRDSFGLNRRHLLIWETLQREENESNSQKRMIDQVETSQ